MLFSTTYLYFEDGKETALIGIKGRAFQITQKTPRHVELFWLDTLQDDFMMRDDINKKVILKSDINNLKN